MTRFGGQTVVITGVGRAGQVGDQLAHAFANEGATIALIGRTLAEVEARRAGFTGESIALGADLTDGDATLRAAREVEEFARPRGGVHAVVHAAGGFGMSGPVAGSEERVWRDQLAINLTTAYMTARAFVPLLRATRGSMLFFSSAAALPHGKVAGLSAYAVAKGGVLTLMRAIAAEEQKHGVRANAIAPTAIRTPDNEKSMGDDARYVEPAELAEAVLFLCSSASSAMTGQVIALG